MASDLDRQQQLQFTAPTIAAGGRRRWLYPDRRQGRHSRRRRALALLLMIIYLATPWMTVADRPLIRVDVLSGTAYVLGAVLRFADTAYVAFLLLGLALLLFLVTAWRGRIWCGYGCPQTVFVEWLIRPIEELLEGSAHHRRLNDQRPLSPGLFIRKTIKHLLFILVAAVVANIFLCYFVEPRQILTWITASPVEHPRAFAVMSSVMLAFYFDLAWFREQFCSFLCPYARLQSVLMDRDTPVVAYDAHRGEPRGKQASGSCIDCGLCQRVCPTGIDIRNGLQMECINCNRCADACDMIMTSLKRPLGLIRTASSKDLEGQSPLPAWRRPRLGLYATGLVLAFAIPTLHLVWFRAGIELAFSRQPGAAFSRMPDGRYANLFNMRSINHEDHAATVAFTVEPAGVEIICGSCATPLPAFSSATHAVIIILPAASRPISEVTLHLSATKKAYKLPILMPANH